MSDHIDTLDNLNKQISLKEKLISAHSTINKSLPFITRIAIAIYDPQTRLLKTFIHSSGEDNPLEHYQASLDDAPSLQKIIDKGLPRVINKPLTYNDNSHEYQTYRTGWLCLQLHHADIE